MRRSAVHLTTIQLSIIEHAGRDAALLIVKESEPKNARMLNWILPGIRKQFKITV
jgi:hypothetical protein